LGAKSLTRHTAKCGSARFGKEAAANERNGFAHDDPTLTECPGRGVLREDQWARWTTQGMAKKKQQRTDAERRARQAERLSRHLRGLQLVLSRGGCKAGVCWTTCTTPSALIALAYPAPN
jgi:hypothetical protein